MLSGGLTAERAPEALQGAGVGGQSAARPGDGGGPRTHPTGPVGLALPALPGSGPLLPPLSQRATFHLIFHKVSQNDEVSPENVEKACHSP